MNICCFRKHSTPLIHFYKSRNVFLVWGGRSLLEFTSPPHPGDSWPWTPSSNNTPVRPRPAGAERWPGEKARAPPFHGWSPRPGQGRRLWFPAAHPTGSQQRRSLGSSSSLDQILVAMVRIDLTYLTPPGVHEEEEVGIIHHTWRIRRSKCMYNHTLPIKLHQERKVHALKHLWPHAQLK
jgi:hypothetical protein